VTALGFPGAAYDRWKTTPPERSDCCAGCGGQMRVDRRDPDSHPYAVVDGELLCSYGCECVYLATQASEPRQVMQHVADALGAGSLVAGARPAGPWSTGRWTARC
jgi:hypothetical protein